MNKNLGFLASSVDPSKLATTVQGIIITATSAIIFLAGHYGIHISIPDVQDVASQIGLIVGTAYTLYGLIHKLIVWASGLWANRGYNG